MLDQVNVIGMGRMSIDFIGRMDGFPEPDSKKKLSEFDVQGGGPAATAMVAVQRLGMQTALISKVCNDWFGKFMIEALENEGVNTSAIHVDETGISPFACIAVERTSGERTILWTDGSAEPIEPGSLDMTMLKNVRAFHMDGHHIEASAVAAECVKKAGGVISYDAGTVRPGVDKLVELADILFATRSFAAEFTGENVIKNALTKMAQKGPEIVGITFGKQGCIGMRNGQIVSSPALKVSAVDTTGAGDVFHGAALFAFLQNWNLTRILDFANIVAGLKCTMLGGRPGIPGLDDAMKYIASRESLPATDDPYACIDPAGKLIHD